MAYPAGVTLITVTGRLAPSPGPYSAKFRPRVATIGSAAGAIVLPRTIRAEVDPDTGAFSVQLPATDDPAWSPAGWEYDVWLSSGDSLVGGALAVAYNGGSFDLAARLNLDQQADQGDSYVLLASRGAPGGVAALDGTGKVPAAQLPASAGGSPDWSEITNKPSAFTPASHTHARADVSGLVDELSDLDDRVIALELAPGGGGGSTLVVRRGTVTSGNLTLPVSGSWVALAGGPLLVLPAAVGDYVEFALTSMLANFTVSFADLAVLVAGAPVRYLATGGSSPATEGAPAFYGDQSFDRVSPLFEFVVESGDLSGGNVTVGFVTKGSGGGTIYASTDYPLRWRALNHGPVSTS